MVGAAARILESAQADAVITIEGVEPVAVAARGREGGDVAVSDPAELIFVARVVLIGIAAAAHRVIAVAVFDVLTGADDAGLRGVPEMRVVQAEVVSEFVGGHRRVEVAVGEVKAHAAHETETRVGGCGLARRDVIEEIILAQVVTVIRRRHVLDRFPSVGGAVAQPGNIRIHAAGDEQFRRDVRTAGTKRGETQFAVGHLPHVVAEVVEMGDGRVGRHGHGLIRPVGTHEQDALPAFRVARLGREQARRATRSGQAGGGHHLIGQLPQMGRSTKGEHGVADFCRGLGAGFAP